jgi:hypothetical protein
MIPMIQTVYGQDIIDEINQAFENLTSNLKGCIDTNQNQTPVVIASHESNKVIN